MKHHGDSGLQEHSVGDIYPAGIMIIHNGKTGRGIVRSYNLIEGTIYADEIYSSMDDDGDFDAARERAVAAVPDGVPYRRVRQLA
jgi:hypothetical protein